MQWIRQSNWKHPCGSIELLPEWSPAELIRKHLIVIIVWVQECVWLCPQHPMKYYLFVLCTLGICGWVYWCVYVCVCVCVCGCVCTSVYTRVSDSTRALHTYFPWNLTQPLIAVWLHTRLLFDYQPFKADVSDTTGVFTTCLGVCVCVYTICQLMWVAAHTETYIRTYFWC